MPIGEAYEGEGGRIDVYIKDWVYSKENKSITQPMVIGAIERDKIERAHFEANNGGDEYADDIRRKIKEDGVRCAITDSRVPTTQSKLARIIYCKDEIEGEAERVNLYFLDREARAKNEMYDLAIKHMLQFSQSSKKQGKQKDDVPDSLANLITNVLEGGSRRGEARSSRSRKELGI